MAGMSMLVLVVIIGVGLTLLMALVIAVLLVLGARTSTQDVTEEPLDTQHSGPRRQATKETP